MPLPPSNRDLDIGQLESQWLQSLMSAVCEINQASSLVVPSEELLLEFVTRNMYSPRKLAIFHLINLHLIGNPSALEHGKKIYTRSNQKGGKSSFRYKGKIDGSYLTAKHSRDVLCNVHKVVFTKYLLERNGLHSTALKNVLLPDYALMIFSNRLSN